MRSYPFTSQVTYDDEGLPLYDRAVDSSFLRRVFAQYFSDGVFYKPTSALQVVADTGMQVAVEPGCCHIQGAIGIEDSRRTLVVQAAESLDRIDTVVARLDLSLAARDIDLYVVKGTAAASPQPPELTRDATVWELGLANLFVAKNTQTISQQRITDTRLDSARCGVVAQTIGALDTEPYYTQLSAMIDDLREVIAGIEAGSEVMLKTTYGGSADGVVKDSDNLGGKAPQWWMPTGSVIPYAGKSAPDGWLLCDGAAVSRTTYAALFTVIGTTFGSGDGSTTFNLPDLRGRVAVGVDSDANLGTRAGEKNRTLTEVNLPLTRDAWTAATDGSAWHSFVKTQTAVPFSIVQPSLYLNYLIKV